MNEDFVSFEIAKKLKEKGFKQGYNIFGYKLIFSNENTIKYISDIGAYENEYFGINIPCPSISQVLKWLREEKKLHIAIDYNNPSLWGHLIYVFGHGYIDKIGEGFNSYEGSAIDAINYVLDNLI